jgi:type II secretory pathway pseudopilin PulG
MNKKYIVVASIVSIVCLFAGLGIGKTLFSNGNNQNLSNCVESVNKLQQQLDNANDAINNQNKALDEIKNESAYAAASTQYDQISSLNKINAKASLGKVDTVYRTSVDCSDK